MSDAGDKYDPFNCLSAQVAAAATEMIQEIGLLSGIRLWNVLHVHEPQHMVELRRAIAKAQAALDSYDVCIAAGINEVTSEEFSRAAKGREGAPIGARASVEA